MVWILVIRLLLPGQYAPAEMSIGSYSAITYCADGLLDYAKTHGDVQIVHAECRRYPLIQTTELDLFD